MNRSDAPARYLMLSTKVMPEVLEYPEQGTVRVFTQAPFASPDPDEDPARNTINLYALNRLSRFVAKRHKRGWRYAWKAVAYQSPDRLGLINLNGTIVAPRPTRPW